ncbi:MAG: haloalkane dehalogenase [Sulfitobacter sp.]
MQIMRTPEDRFTDLEGYSYAPHYTDVTAKDGTTVRIHHIDEGEGPLLICMHGQPTWSFLWRKMVGPLTKAGFRVVAPDLVGFGKSDKPAAQDDYTYANHVDWMSQWLSANDFTDATLVCQDWGGLIGLRMLTADPDRFDRIVVANTGLPDNVIVKPEVSAMLEQLAPNVTLVTAAELGPKMASGAPDAFLHWIKFAAESPEFTPSSVFSPKTPAPVIAGYDAPFPNEEYFAGARKFPMLVPILPHHAGDRADNDKAWEILGACEKPLLTAFSDQDPVTKGGEVAFQKRVPGAQGVKHVTIEGGGHFLQEDKPEEFAAAIIDFMRDHAS